MHEQSNTNPEATPIDLAKLPPEGQLLEKTGTFSVSFPEPTGTIYGYDTIPVDGGGSIDFSNKFHTTWGRPVASFILGENGKPDGQDPVTVIEGTTESGASRYYLLHGDGYDPKSVGLVAEIPQISKNQSVNETGLVYGRDPKTSTEVPAFKNRLAKSTVSRTHLAIAISHSEDGSPRIEVATLGPTFDTVLKPVDLEKLPSKQTTVANGAGRVALGS